MIMSAETSSDDGGYFMKTLNEWLESVEQISYQIEESLLSLLGQNPGNEDDMSKPAAEDGPSTNGQSSEFEMNDDDHDEDDVVYSPLGDIADGVLGDIMQSQKKPEGFLEGLDAFRHAITWSEPFVLGLVIFQVVMLAISVWAARKNRSLTVRILLMSTIFGIVRGAERFNRWGARNWKRFCTQDYFDRQGMFVSIMVAAPLLVDSLIMLILFVREAGQLLVTVKRAQLKEKLKKGNQNSSEKGSGARGKKEKDL